MCQTTSIGRSSQPPCCTKIPKTAKNSPNRHPGRASSGGLPRASGLPPIPHTARFFAETTPINMIKRKQAPGHASAPSVHKHPAPKGTCLHRQPVVCPNPLRARRFRQPACICLAGAGRVTGVYSVPAAVGAGATSRKSARGIFDRLSPRYSGSRTKYGDWDELTT